MEKDIANDPTAVLMQNAKYGNGDDALSFRSREMLIKRWSRGTDLEFLVDLLRSERSSDRLLGAYYLGEVGRAVEELKVPATELASDPLPNCRWAFVSYMANSGYYDETIADGLSKCLLDLNLYVRVTTLKWAIGTSDEIFEQFSRLVESGAGGPEPKFPNPLSNDFWNAASLKRAVRGLDIIRRLRAGEKVQDFRKDFPGEDSFVLDNILFSETRRDRHLEWQKIKSGH